MGKLIFISILIIFNSCWQANSNLAESEMIATEPKPDSDKVSIPSPFVLNDTTIKFLWRENKYFEEYKDSMSSIIINEEYCKMIPPQCKAAIGYVATFVGNECWWDGEGKSDRSNLKCKILTALNLGYQCSETHLGYLRQWFKGDTKSLETLKTEDCPTVPYTSTIQDTFDELTLIVKGNRILISFIATASNVREQSSSSWMEKDYFEYTQDHIQLINKEVKQL